MEAYMLAMALAAVEEEGGKKACQLVKTRFQLVRMSWRERARGGRVVGLVSSANWLWMLGWRPLLEKGFVVADGRLAC